MQSTEAKYWYVVGLSRDEKNFHFTTQLLDKSILIVSFNGELKAFEDRCPHFGAKLSLGKISEEKITCPYHGWQFEKQGKCQYIPSQPNSKIPKNACLKSYKIIKKLGWIWINLDNNPYSPPDLPSWWEDQKRLIDCKPYLFKTIATRVIENFLDITHLPFVHEGILGDSEVTELEKITLNIIDNKIIHEPVKVWQPNPDSKSHGSYVSYSYVIHKPLLADFNKQIDNKNFRIILAVTPQSITKCIAWVKICLDYDHKGQDHEIQKYQDDIIAQDIGVVESIEPKEFKLNDKNELPVKADIGVLNYRQWLIDNMFLFGMMKSDKGSQ